MNHCLADYFVTKLMIQFSFIIKIIEGFRIPETYNDRK